LLRVLLFIIIVLAVTFSLNSLLDTKEVVLTEYNSRVLSFTYYKVLFDNIVDSGLFDGVYEYSPVSDKKALFPLYILTYYDEDSEQYALALSYDTSNAYTLTPTNYNPLSNNTGVTINTQKLNNLKEKLDELHNNIGVNMVVYYDVNKVYENQCHNPVKYSFETIYIDSDGLPHVIEIIFC